MRPETDTKARTKADTGTPTVVALRARFSRVDLLRDPLRERAAVVIDRSSEAAHDSGDDGSPDGAERGRTSLSDPIILDAPSEAECLNKPIGAVSDAQALPPVQLRVAWDRAPGCASRLTGLDRAQSTLSSLAPDRDAA